MNHRHQTRGVSSREPSIDLVQHQTRRVVRTRTDLASRDSDRFAISMVHCHPRRNGSELCRCYPPIGRSTLSQCLHWIMRSNLRVSRHLVHFHTFSFSLCVPTPPVSVNSSPSEVVHVRLLPHEEKKLPRTPPGRTAAMGVFSLLLGSCFGPPPSRPFPSVSTKRVRILRLLVASSVAQKGTWDHGYRTAGHLGRSRKAEEEGKGRTRRHPAPNPGQRTVRRRGTRNCAAHT